MSVAQRVHARRAVRTSCENSGNPFREVVGHFRLFLGVEVVEIAEELVESVIGRQYLIQVAEMVLAELAGGVARGS